MKTIKKTSFTLTSDRLLEFNEAKTAVSTAYGLRLNADEFLHFLVHFALNNPNFIWSEITLKDEVENCDKK